MVTTSMRWLAMAAMIASLTSTAEGWATTTTTTVMSSLSSSPLSGSATRAVTRWDRHLDLARTAHSRRRWPEVRVVCSRVIDVSDDWNAVEQAHLRLALAEQNDKRVDAARRAFQQGTAACPSSDTLFMAWALMESKIHNSRNRKVARALLHRAVALNPKRHSGVVKWRVFLDLKEAGEAAVEAVKSAISNGQPVISVSVPPSSSDSSTVVSSTITTGPTAINSRPTATFSSAAVGVTDEDRGGSGSPRGSGEVVVVNSSRRRSSSNRRSSSAAAAAGNRSPSVASVAFASTHAPPAAAAAAGFLANWGNKRSQEKELALATDLLALCSTIATNDDDGGTLRKGVAREESFAVRFKELAGELERRGGGVVSGGAGGGGGEERELAGSWRLVCTTCSVCERVLARAGGEVYQRLTPPIVEITPKACEPSVPFLCEVILRPSERARGSSNKAIGTTGATSAAASAASAAGDQSAKSVTYFLRGWAEAPANRGGDRDRVSLRQQVAPRSARVAGVGGAGGGRRVSMPPPPAVFSALGHVARGGKRLEKLVTQEVTYVGEQLRIGRTKGGDVYVYERCDWPEEM